MLTFRAGRVGRQRKKCLAWPRRGVAKQAAPQLARRTVDPRLVQLGRAVDEMTTGVFKIKVPKTKDGVGLIGRALDRLAHRLAERLERALRLMRLSEGIHTALTVEDALDYLYYSFRSVVPFDRLGCALLSESGKATRAVWARSKVTAQFIGAGYSADLANTSLAEVLRTREPRVINDLEAYLAAHPNSESTRLIVAEGMRSSLTCPIFATRRPVGFLFFSSKERDAYRSEHVEFYQQISRVVGSVIERATLYEDLKRTKEALEDANTRLQALADFDALTMIPNRRAFDHRLEIEWRRAKRSNQPLSVLMIDVDDFKAFNDRYGHLPGDQCLKRVAGAIAGSLRRAGDFVARFGGEEFAVVLPASDERQAAKVAERCLEAVRALKVPHDRARSAPFVTLSIGSATWDGVREAEISDLLTQADAALYRAKNEGRNTSSLAPRPVGADRARHYRNA